MATNNSLKKQMQGSGDNKDKKPEQYPVKTLLNSPSIKKRFEEVLGKRSNQFAASVLALVNNDDYLAACEPMTIIQSAMQAAVFDLPLDKNLGFAYIVPYWDNDDGKRKAQFQMGYRGYIQLAQRSGQYKHINMVTVYDGQLVSFNPLTEEIELDFDAKKSNDVQGYVAYFELLNGFRKTVYWTADEVETHRIKYNKAKDKKALSGAWRDNYDFMAKKTVLRNALSKWGIMSIEMQSATSIELNNESDAPEPVLLASEEGEVIDLSVGDGYEVDPNTGEVLMDGMTNAEVDAMLAAEEA